MFNPHVLMEAALDGIEKAKTKNARYEMGDRHPDFHGVVFVTVEPSGADEQIGYQYAITESMLQFAGDSDKMAERFGEEVARFLEAVGWWLGDEAAEDLKEGYRENNVKWHPHNELQVDEKKYR